MKTFSAILIFIFFVLTGCNTVKSTEIDQEQATTVPDTGYTGIKQYTSGNYIIKEVTFENGVREGLMRSFYAGGQVRQTYWYEKGLREDSIKWYYIEGQLFRSTPYRHDTLHGIQKQYYRTGKVRAMIGYERGLRLPYIEEFTATGKKIKFPEMLVNTTDKLASDGTIQISLQMANNSKKVKFFTGELNEGRYDTAIIKPVKTVAGVGNLILRKSDIPADGKVGVIGEMITDFGNKYLVYKNIDLPK